MNAATAKCEIYDLAIFWVAEIEAGTAVPFRALIALGWDAVIIFEQLGQVHKIPGHEGGVAIGEVVVQPGFAAVAIVVAVTGAGTGFADPTGVGLGRDHAAQVLEAVEDVHGAVFDAVFVAGDKATADLTVVGVLPFAVE